jgi:hypothetical protein
LWNPMRVSAIAAGAAAKGGGATTAGSGSTSWVKTGSSR